MRAISTPPSNHLCPFYNKPLTNLSPAQPKQITEITEMQNELQNTPKHLENDTLTPYAYQYM